MPQTKVVVGMSGGVDSSAAAYLLQEEGYDVIGVTMEIWEEDSPEIDDARRICTKLGIPHYVLNSRNEFEDKIISYFTDEYKSGRTPNPCIMCNRYIKFEALLTKAKELGADYIATGHYAKIVKDDATGRYTLKQSKAGGRDQTYALYKLTQDQLAHTLMPLWEYNKDEVRKVAEKVDVDMANKPDSQEICFIPDDDYGSYIENNTDTKIIPGDFVDTKGNILGKHKGIIHYTVGQRRGLGIQSPKPLYVVKIDPKANQVIVGGNKEVFQDTAYVINLNFMAIEKLNGKMEFQAKVRYSQKTALCTVEMKDKDTMICRFHKPQRAITPGQALVLYDKDKGEKLVAGGKIISTANNN